MTDAQFDVVGACGPRLYFSRVPQAQLSHAYLFTGPSGIGKKWFARELARARLCENASDSVLGYCGTCSSCRLFGESSTRHPDFFEHCGEIKIGDSDAAIGFHDSHELTSRDLVRQLNLRSYSGGMRILLLGDVEFSTMHAANALLKFFEEPPAGVLVILTSSTPGRIIPTIRSRMVELSFAALTREEIVGALRKRGLDEQRSADAAALAQGSLARAISLVDEGEESLRASVTRWFFAAAANDVSEENWATRETLDEGIEIVRLLARDWVALSTVGGQSAMGTADARDRLRTLPVLSSANAVCLLGRLDDARGVSHSNVSANLVSEMMRMAVVGALR